MVDIKRKVIIDGDSIAYKAGYAPSPDACVMSVNNQMSQIIDDTMADDYELYIEEYRKDKKLFRSEMFVLSNLLLKEDKQGYKGNRTKNKADIPYLDLARECMVSTWGAKRTTIHEAEDIVSMRYHKLLGSGKCLPVIAAIDKDLFCNEGDYYNYDSKKRFTTRITKRQAIVNKWRQVICGDSTDNIPGIPGLGAAKAEKLIQSHRKAGLIAALVYKILGATYGYFIEQYNLIYIRTDGSSEVLKPLTESKWINLFQDNGILLECLLNEAPTSEVLTKKFVENTREKLKVLH